MTLTFAVIIKPFNDHQRKYTDLAIKGLINQGLKYIGTFTMNTAMPLPKADFYITWSLKLHQKNTHWEALAKSGKPIMVLERGFLGNRENWLMVGWNGINNRADYCNKSITNNSRFSQFQHLMKPWNPVKNNIVLITGQLPWDTTVSNVNIHEWYDKTIKELINKGKQVWYRPHPLLDRQPYHNNLIAKYITQEPLETTLEHVSACVTYSSNSGVSAMLQGIPATCADEYSMIWNIARHDLEDLNYQPDREQWAAQLAYCQWNLKEIENGDFWTTLKKKLIL